MSKGELPFSQQEKGKAYPLQISWKPGREFFSVILFFASFSVKKELYVCEEYLEWGLVAGLGKGVGF